MNQKDIDRQKKLEALQEEHRMLTTKKQQIKQRMNKDVAEITEINKELSRLGNQIFDMKNEDGDTPHITDHAVVRYLERVKKVDIWEIKAEIAAHKDAVRVINTIVTVNGEDEDEKSDNS